MSENKNSQYNINYHKGGHQYKLYDKKKNKVQAHWKKIIWSIKREKSELQNIANEVFKFGVTKLACTKLNLMMLDAEEMNYLTHPLPVHPEPFDIPITSWKGPF